MNTWCLVEEWYLLMSVVDRPMSFISIDNQGLSSRYKTEIASQCFQETFPATSGLLSLKFWEANYMLVTCLQGLHYPILTCLSDSSTKMIIWFGKILVPIISFAALNMACFGLDHYSPHKYYAILLLWLNTNLSPLSSCQKPLWGHQSLNKGDRRGF